MKRILIICLVLMNEMPLIHSVASGIFCISLFK